MKSILCVVSEEGHWGEELIASLEVFEEAGYAVDLATPTGGKPQLKLIADVMVTALLETLQSVLNISKLVKKQPNVASPTYKEDLKKYNESKEKAEQIFDLYDALVVVGDSQKAKNVINNQRVQDIALSFYENNKPIVAPASLETALGVEKNEGGAFIIAESIEDAYKASASLVQLFTQ